MSVLLIIVAGVVTMSLAILRRLAVDEVSGRLEKRISEHLEATIASMTPDLQGEWAEEWRAELAGVLSMPLMAVRCARGLRRSAKELMGVPVLSILAGLQQRASALKAAARRTAHCTAEIAVARLARIGDGMTALRTVTMTCGLLSVVMVLRYTAPGVADIVRLVNVSLIFSGLLGVALFRLRSVDRRR